MQTYLTPDGFERPTLAELMQQIGDQMFNALGPINRNPASGIGQLIGIFSDALGVSYETAEELFNSRFLRSANGLALDAFGDWLGLPRRAKTNTTSPVILYGDDSTIVPAGAVSQYANHNFTLDKEVTIATSNTVDITFRVSTSIAPGDKVAIRMAGLNQTFVANVTASSTAASVARDLAQQINVAGAAVTTGVTFKSSAIGTDVRIWTDNLSTGFAATVSPNSTLDRLVITKIGSPGDVTATETGPISVPAHQLTKPVTGIAGWYGIDNPVDASIGADRESDTDYRRRLQSSDGTVNGLATPAAIKRVVQAVSGVTAVTVLTNPKMYTDANGQTAKSFQTIVSGGSPSEIVAAIYSAGAAGIETYGTEQDTYTDTDGSRHFIFFSRPTPLIIKITVNVTKTEDEETLTPNVKTVIEQAVRTYFAGLSLGEDIIPQRILGPIYASTTGLANIEFTFKGSNGATITPVDGIIEVSPTQTAVLADVDGVTVVGV